MRKFILFSWLFLSITIPTYSQIDEIIRENSAEQTIIKDTLSRVYDAKPIQVRKFKKDLAQEYDSDDYRYNRSVRYSGENLFEKFVSWLVQKLRSAFGFNLSPLTVKIITYIIYFLLGALVVYLIIRFLNIEGINRLFSKTIEEKGTVSLESAHIEEIDIDALLKESLSNGDYRQAVRYQYLGILKSLSKRNLIDWDYQKTNVDYYRELQDTVTKQQFKDVSYLYDYVWYGEFDIDKTKYDESQPLFNALNRAAS